jgi:hypothetical protein
VPVLLSGSLVFNAGMNRQAAHDFQNLILDLRDFLLSAVSIQNPGLEIDHDSVQVLDFVDHFVRGSAKLPEPALFAQRAVAAVLELHLGELSCFPHGIINGRSRNGAVVQKCNFRIELVDEPELSDVFDSIEPDSQDRSIAMAID